MTKDKPQGCLFAIFSKLFGSTSADGTSTDAFPYRRKDYLLSKAERSFFGVLQDAVGDQYLIFAMVRLADLIYIPRGTESRQSHLNRIISKHIDFVLCDPKTVRPLLAIELDDSSHNRADRKDRDAFVNDALDAADLPLLRVPARRGYNEKELFQSIHNSIHG